MARRTNKQPRQPKHESPVGVKAPLLPTGLLISILVTIVLAGIPFGLGKYIELNSPGPFDSGAFVYSAKHLLNGAKMGVDEYPSAKPNTLLANLIGVKLFGFNDYGPKIVQMLLQLAALIFMFWTVNKVFGNIAAIISTTLASLYLSAPLIAKFGNVKEQFMIPFMIAAACCFCWYKLAQKRRWLVLTGFMALQPYFSKPTGMSVVFAIVLYILISNITAKNWKKLVHEISLFLAGYAAGLIIPASLFLWQKQPGTIFTSFPAVAIELAAILTVIIAGMVYGIAFLKKHVASTQQLKVSKKIWLIGLVLMGTALIVSVGLIRIQPGYLEGDIASYLNSTFPAKIGAFFNAQFAKVMRAAGLNSGYVAGSRSARSIAEVAPQILRYYKAPDCPDPCRNPVDRNRCDHLAAQTHQEK